MGRESSKGFDGSKAAFSFLFHFLFPDIDFLYSLELFRLGLRADMRKVGDDFPVCCE